MNEPIANPDRPVFGQKECTNCLIHRPLYLYKYDHRTKDGLSKVCNPCSKNRAGRGK